MTTSTVGKVIFLGGDALGWVKRVGIHFHDDNSTVSAPASAEPSLLRLREQVGRVYPWPANPSTSSSELSSLLLSGASHEDDNGCVSFESASIKRRLR